MLSCDYNNLNSTEKIIFFLESNSVFPENCSMNTVSDHMTIIIYQKYDVNMFDWWYQTFLSKYDVNYPIIDKASEYNRVDILNWSLTKNLSYSVESIDKASRLGHKTVLEWWFTQKVYPIAFTSYAIDFVAYNGKVEILDTWENSGYNIEYTCLAIDKASAMNRVDMLDWWYARRKKYTFKYSKNAVDDASIFGSIEALNWWKTNFTNLKYSNNAFMFSKDAGTKSIDWWISLGIKIECSIELVINAFIKGNLEVINKLYDYCDGFECDNRVLRIASYNKDLSDWLKNKYLM